ncbi:HD domain-containing protein [Pseudonocardia sp. C8]|uniref:HD domain-containing protein n=1 Tax=Pseudonocardia sp. C8 TaxID=2762759 RepID=UPI001C9319E2
MHGDSDRDLARLYLERALPRRWRHVQGVARRAEAVAGHLDDGELLVTAAWLHDIGYAPELAETGFHPLDGARALRELGVGARLWGLVAHHSAAVHEAQALGMADELDEFADERGLVRDLLWFFDMTTSPDGGPVTFAQRMADIRDRYPPGHYVIRSLGPSLHDRRAAVERAGRWLHAVGLDPRCP